jgi:hypothetical protein
VHASQIEAPTQCDPHEYAFSQTPADTPGESGETNNHVTLMSRGAALRVARRR